jgi:hypothetical protein
MRFNMFVAMLLIFKDLKSCLSFLPDYIPPLAKGDRGGFLGKEIIHKISPRPSFPKRG